MEIQNNIFSYATLLKQVKALNDSVLIQSKKSFRCSAMLNIRFSPTPPAPDCAP